jgi:hypothetical protein
VVDHRGLAVHDLGRRNHVAAEDLTDALVAEADAEHGTPLEPKYSIASNEIPASSGRPGPGETRSPSGEKLEAVEVELVVSNDDRLGAELAQILHEVVDEAVVVVDDENTGSHGPRLPAPCGARLPKYGEAMPEKNRPRQGSGLRRDA